MNFLNLSQYFIASNIKLIDKVVPMIAMGVVLQHLKAKTGPEYVMTLVDCYAKEHSKNIELRSAPTHSDNKLIIRKRPFLPPLLTQPVPVNIFLDKQWNVNYHYLTTERAGKLARGIAELLLKDARLCVCSNNDECSSYLEVMSVLEAGARIAFDQLHHGIRADFQSHMALENDENKVTKRSPGEWWNPFIWRWHNRTAVQGKHCDKQIKKQTIIPKRIQVKYLKKH